MSDYRNHGQNQAGGNTQPPYPYSPQPYQTGDYGASYQQPQRAGSYQPQPVSPQGGEPSFGQTGPHGNGYHTYPPYYPQGTNSYSGPWQPVGSQTGGHDPVQDGVDPNLAKVRSDRVVDRKGKFWKPPEEANHSKAKQLLLVLAVSILVLAAIYGVVFRARNCYVEGNSRFTDEEVLTLAGITPGAHVHSIETGLVEGAINNNRYLVFRSLEIIYPDTVILTVRERQPMAVLNYCGINYTIDRAGMVLEESNDVVNTSDLIEISGIDVRGQNGCTVGRRLSLKNNRQLTVISDILLELKVLSVYEAVVHIKVSDMNSIKIETKEGYTVNIGDSSDLHRKLKSMTYVRQKLIEMNQRSGTMDVTNPEVPTFIPEI